MEQNGAKLKAQFNELCKMDAKENTKRRRVQLRVDGMLADAQAKLYDSDATQSYTTPDNDGSL